MHTESNERKRPYLRPLYGNVVEVLSDGEKVAVVRFAIDNMLGCYDQTERKTNYKTKYFNIKFFKDALCQFKTDSITKGDRLDLLDYDYIWELRYDKKIGQTLEICDLGIKKYIHHPKNKDSETLGEPDIPSIDLKKSTIHSNTANDSEGDPSWMTE